MHHWTSKTLFILVSLLSLRAAATNFPGALTNIEVERIVQSIGHGAATRIMRSADPYDLFPGIKLGMEFVIVPTRDINSLGNGVGNLPSLIPMPRFYISKGLFLDLELVLSFLPSNIINTLSTYGFALKWTFSREQEKWASMGLYLAYTGITAYSSTYEGSDYEVGLIVGKDYVRLKPYIGGGLLVASGQVNQGLVVATAKSASWQSTIHLYLGSEIELPVNITFQFDLMNLNPGGSLFFGKRF